MIRNPIDDSKTRNMGHRLSVMDHEGDKEDPETEASLAFFRGLKLKWTKYMMAKIAAGLTSDLDIYNDRELISWRLYLKIFSDIRQKMDEDNENEKRNLYHPACRGFIMTRINVPKDLEMEEESFDFGDKGPADDYTEDAESENSDDEDDEEESEDEESSSDEESSEDETDDEEEEDDQGGKAAGDGQDKKKKKAKKGIEEQGDDEEKGAAEQQLAVIVTGDEDSSAAGGSPSPGKSKGGSLSSGGKSLLKSSAESYISGKSVNTRTKEWNPELTSPIYFGYSYKPARQHDESVEAERLAVREAEERAVQKTKATRTALLDDFEIAMKNQHANRLRKITKLQEDYDKARTKREEDLRRLQAELPAVAFNAFKATWELEYLAAEEAFDAEIGKMTDFHEKQCASDRETVQKRRDELEAFKDAEVTTSASPHFPYHPPRPPGGWYHTYLTYTYTASCCRFTSLSLSPSSAIGHPRHPGVASHATPPLAQTPVGTP